MARQEGASAPYRGIWHIAGLRGRPASIEAANPPHHPVSTGGSRGRGPVSFAKEFWKRTSEDDVSGLSAELAYRYFLSFIPFLIFLTALSALLATVLTVDNPTERIVGEIAPNLPAGATAVVQDQLDRILRSPNAGILSVTFVLATLSASSATSTLLKAVGRIYSRETRRPLWKKQLLSIGLVLVGGGALLLGFFAIVASRWYVGWAIRSVGLGAVAEAIFQALVFLGIFVALVAVIVVVHRIGSDRVSTIRQALPGAVLSAAAWIAATYLFGLYVANFGSYSNTYGALGGVVVLLLWFYMSNFVLLLGAELNDVLMG